jgi:copper chaperone CopZ
MKIPSRLIAFALASLFPAGTLLAEVREWTRASDGRKISAEFAGMKDESTVKIKMGNGQIFELPLTGLSAEDNAYIKAANAKMAGGAKPAAGAAPAVPEGETTVTISAVHLCCGDCVDAVAKIGTSDTNPIPVGVTLSADRKAGSIIVKAPSGKDAQAALRAVFKAGFYGISDNPAVGFAELKPDDFTTDTMVIRDPHLCCGGCVKAYTKAVESVNGVESCEAKVGAARTEVTGKGFKTYEVMKALRDAGFAGTFQ